MSEKEMRAYITDAANRLKGKQLLRMLYLRATNLMGLTEWTEQPVPTTASNSTEKALAKEIRHVIERNPNEAFLRKLLTRAIILEKLLGRTDQKGGGSGGRAYI